AFDHVEIEQLRIDVGDDALRLDLSTAGKHATSSAMRADRYSRHRCIGKKIDTERTSLRRHGLRDRAHPADRVSPLPSLAVDFADDVVQQHVARAGRIGTRKITDDCIESERGLDRIRLKPAVENVPRALGEQVEQITMLSRRHTSYWLPDLPRLEPFEHS